MKKEELTEAIKEGINQSEPSIILKSIIVGILLIGVMLIIGLIINSFIHPIDYSKMTTSRQVNCNYPYVECSISDHSELLGGTTVCPEDTNLSDDLIPACIVTSTYFQIVDNKNNICGYQEALAYFNLFKQNYPLNTNELQLVCTQ